MGEFRWTGTNKEMVAMLKEHYPQVKTAADRPFKKAIYEAFPEVDDVDPKFQPDAWVVDVEGRRIDLFEAEVTHAIERKTMWNIAYFWMACDFVDVELNLYIVTRYAHINKLEIAPIYYTMLAERAAQSVLLS